MSFTPSYIQLLETGEFEKRINSAKKLLVECAVCPRHCRVERANGELGFCHSSTIPIVSSFTAHYGEEPDLSGTNGAGNIFFGNCNLSCVFCQNYEISQNWKAENYNTVSVERVAELMIELQNRGYHNIGLVSPTHFSVQILEAIFLAAKNGLHLPIIYNSNGYDSVETLKLFEDVIDIYLPDFKYGNDEYAKKFSNADNYFEVAKNALKEMFRQVGDELVYKNNVAVRGMIIRHLVLPNDLADSEKVFEFIAKELSPTVHISLMSQYFPTNKANRYALLDRKIRNSEYEKVIALLEKYELMNGWIQELESSDFYIPHFNESRLNPFEN